MLLKCTSIPDTQQQLWQKVLTKDFISSEESGVDGEDQHQVLVIRPLEWRSSKVDRFFNRLDRKMTKNKTKQSKQQTLPRVTGEKSLRPKPSGFADDFFGFQSD